MLKYYQRKGLLFVLFYLLIDTNLLLILNVCKYNERPIKVAVRSKEWTVFAHSNTGIVGSNPTRGMDVCVRLFCVQVVADPPSKESYRICKDQETEKAAKAQ
jgi:hypothetical protein